MISPVNLPPEVAQAFKEVAASICAGLPPCFSVEHRKIGQFKSFFAKPWSEHQLKFLLNKALDDAPITLGFSAGKVRCFCKAHATSHLLSVLDESRQPLDHVIYVGPRVVGSHPRRTLVFEKHQAQAQEKISLKLQEEKGLEQLWQFILSRAKRLGPRSVLCAGFPGLDQIKATLQASTEVYDPGTALHSVLHLELQLKWAAASFGSTQSGRIATEAILSNGHAIARRAAGLALPHVKDLAPGSIPALMFSTAQNTLARRYGAEELAWCLALIGGACAAAGVSLVQILGE